MTLVNIDVYSHNVVVSQFGYRCREALLAYCKTLGQLGRVKVGSQYVWRIVKVFVGCTADRSEFHFHINQYSDVIDQLKRFGILESQMEIKTHKPKEGMSYKMPLLPKWILRDNQIPIVDYILEPGITKTLPIQAGFGKSISLDSDLKTPTGWIKMGEVKVGDILTAPDGTDTKVTGVYPQGVTSVYRVTFEDGRSVETCEEHLWSIVDASGSKQVVSTGYIADYLSEGIDSVSIPLIDTNTKNPLSTRFNCTGKDALVICLTDNEVLNCVYDIRSLGGLINNIEKTNRGEFAVSYRIGTKRLDVVSVVYSGVKPTQCISVDHPDCLYITNDFIVTHNTTMALTAASKIGKRTVVTVRAQYVKKWVSDIKEHYGYGPKEIMTVQGSKDLKTLIKLAKAGELDSRFIIISNKTLHGFIKHYESTSGDRTLYGTSPAKLLALLGIGLLIRDEVHLDFHFNYRTDLYTHVPKTLNLSATLVSDDNFINKMFAVMFPIHTRYNKSVYKKYIIATAISYRIAYPKKIQCQNFAFKSYSHVLFEQSIMRSSAVLGQYFDLIWYIMDITYMRERKPGLKLLIYFSTTEMCTLAVNFLKTKAPLLTIKRKVEEDPYQNMLTADVVVSTLQSVGTGHDIPGLFKTINTVSINGRQINEQAKGRLRELKGEWDGLVPEYIYLFCKDIPKQVEYHVNKLDQFKDTVVAHVERASGHTLKHSN